MSFNKWIKKSQYIKDKSFLIIKNGIEYKVALTSARKPKYKKHKISRRKKYFLSGVELLGITIADQKEIEQIYNLNPIEKIRYELMFQMPKNCFYAMHLTPKQYKCLTRFLDKQKIELNDAFYFRRHGSMIYTYFRFYNESKMIKKE